VIANYRYGSGADAPDPGTLTVILNPIPGVRSIRNPVPVGGGADPDPAGQIRQYAPQSVLTFGRAVSGDDYETIAAQAPGVARARAYWSFDPDEQRTIVTVYVGDDAAALDSTRAALALAHDPNRPLNVRLAKPVPAQLTLTLRIDASYDPAPVVAAATAALIDPDSGLFGTAHVRIGASIFESQIYDACLSVPGTLAVHHLQFTSSVTTPGSFRFDPGEAGFFQLPATALTLHQEIANAG
jgi:phage-related baseplate assembly protein